MLGRWMVSFALVTLLLASASACRDEVVRDLSGEPPPATAPATQAEAGTQPAPDPTPVTYRGIDASHYQSTIDWEQVHADGITFAIVKATEGREDVDPNFEANWKALEDLPIVRGAYHFFYPAIDAEAQADHFIATVKLKPGDLPPVLDVEKSQALAAGTIDEDVRLWLTKVEAAFGVKPILYSDPHFIDTYLGEAFADYPLWLAEYTDAPPSPPEGWDRWTFWQSTQAGTVPGVEPEVDLNEYRGTVQHWESLRIQAALSPDV